MIPAEQEQTDAVVYHGHQARELGEVVFDAMRDARLAVVGERDTPEDRLERLLRMRAAPCCLDGGGGLLVETAFLIEVAKRGHELVALEKTHVRRHHRHCSSFQVLAPNLALV